ncbi:MAG: hypothetical protein J6S14_11920 [Clostridia bacterium]|nr:hypothetical protein [Clostridia bacterium]
MDIEKTLFQALQEATRHACADIEKAAAAHKEKQEKRLQVMNAYIEKYGDTVGLILYHSYLENKEG